MGLTCLRPVGVTEQRSGHSAMGLVFRGLLEFTTSMRWSCQALPGRVFGGCGLLEHGASGSEVLGVQRLPGCVIGKGLDEERVAANDVFPVVSCFGVILMISFAPILDVMRFLGGVVAGVWLCGAAVLAITNWYLRIGNPEDWTSTQVISVASICTILAFISLYFIPNKSHRTGAFLLGFFLLVFLAAIFAANSSSDSSLLKTIDSSSSLRATMTKDQIQSLAANQIESKINSILFVTYAATTLLSWLVIDSLRKRFSAMKTDDSKSEKMSPFPR